MSAKAKQKAIADLIQQFKDNTNADSIKTIGDKIISEVNSIPAPDNFHFLVTITNTQLKTEFARFAEAKESGDKLKLEEAKTALGYILTLQVMPIIVESYPLDF